MHTGKKIKLSPGFIPDALITSSDESFLFPVTLIPEMSNIGVNRQMTTRIRKAKNAMVVFRLRTLRYAADLCLRFSLLSTFLNPFYINT